MATNYRVNLGFSAYSSNDLNTFTGTVVTCMTDNPFYLEPPLKPEALEAIRVVFWSAVVAAQQGGVQLTAEKNNQYDVLVLALRQLATYVQGIASQNLATLLSSGFLANSTNRAQAPLPMPVMVSVDTSATTKMVAQVQPVANAVAYQARAGISGVWLPPVTSTQSRSIIITGLTPGTLYDLQFCALGGSTGQSEWTNAISYRAT